MPIRNYAEGLKLLIHNCRRHASIPFEKISTMQDIYLKKNLAMYSKAEPELIKYYLKAVSYKFHLMYCSLEQLWALSELKRKNIVFALENSLDRLEVSDDEMLAISFAFEGFLLQSRTFLDFYMLYICIFLQTGHRGSISKNKFLSELNKASKSKNGDKAKSIKEYFENSVFSDDKQLIPTEPTNWGNLMVSIRDKIAHRDRIRPSFKSKETLINDVLFDWPTLRDVTYDFLCQYIQNGMFALICNVSPLLYDLEWKAGPLTPGMWKEAH